VIGAVSESQLQRFSKLVENFWMLFACLIKSGGREKEEMIEARTKGGISGVRPPLEQLLKVTNSLFASQRSQE